MNHAQSVLSLVCASCVSLVLCSSSPAHAQRTEYVPREQIAREPVPLAREVAMMGRYQRVLDAGRASSLQNLGEFALRTRLMVGARVAYTAGLDLTIGGAEPGVAYTATAYAAGVGVRWGDASGLALSSGVGVSAVGTAIPLALSVPAELRWTQSAGPLRFALWMTWSWAFANDLRRHGSPTLPFVDEAEVGASIRVGRQQRYWGTYSGGAGPALGVSYRESMGARIVGVTLGFELAGAR